MTCSECGAVYENPGDSCEHRFNTLLALDHSRREPWGSRHGQAFAAYALQHPELHARSLDQAWAMLYRIYLKGERAEDVVRDVRAARGAVVASGTPPRPSNRLNPPTVTIVDLGAFDAATYATQLDVWCRASLASWGAPVR